MARSALEGVLSQVPAASAPINGADSARALADRAYADSQKQDQLNLQKLKTQELKTVSLAPQYNAYFGEVMTVSINGMSIYFPVDGRNYRIPADYAKVVHERRRRVDDLLIRTRRMANIRQNKEDSIGGLELIPR